MIKRLLLIKSPDYLPYPNQATEAALTEYAGDDTFILYLWANDKTVFIGKNQNAFLECDVNALEKAGGFLARRITGGGAVYHDKGNLNYTFIAPRGDYDEARQFGYVREALSSLGFEPELSGRNDITVCGKKFSGNAFYHGDKFGLHHGTLLIRSDRDAVGRYLSASKIKLEGKGVKSVGSRIINLSDVRPVTKEDISDALVEAVSTGLGLRPEQMPFDEVDRAAYDKWYNFFTDKKRLYGDDIYYDARIEKRFEWGTADIRLQLKGSVIAAAKVYTDALDTALAERKEAVLIGEDIYNVKNEEAKEIILCVKEFQ